MGNRKKVRYFSFLILILTAIIQTGCWGVAETDQLAYILAMGIDKGERNIIKVTFQIAVPKALAGAEGAGGGEPLQNVSVEAASVFGALQLANAFVSRELTFIHNRLVVVSDEIAREGLNRYINPLIRSREIRRNTFIMVTRGSPKEFLEKNKPDLELNPSPQFEQILGKYRKVGFMVETIMNDFSNSTKNPGKEPVLALVGITRKDKKEEGGSLSREKMISGEVAYLPGEVPREGGNEIEVIGLAVFRGDNLVGYLDGRETRYYQMVTPMFHKAIFTFPDPEKPEQDIVVIEIKAGRKPVREVEYFEGKTVLKADLVLEGEILSLQSGINYEKGDKLEKLEKYLEDFITREVLAVIKKTQKEFQSDIFGFGENTRKHFWTYPAWESYNWRGIYPQAEIDVKVDLRMRRSGLMIRTAPISGGVLE